MKNKYILEYNEIDHNKISELLTQFGNTYVLVWKMSTVTPNTFIAFGCNLTEEELVIINLSTTHGVDARMSDTLFL